MTNAVSSANDQDLVVAEQARGGVGKQPAAAFQVAATPAEDPVERVDNEEMAP